MKTKFFVPYETAQALKAAGYPQDESDYVYYQDGCLYPRLMSTNEQGFIAAQTYHEVVNWLEQKNLCIVVDVDSCDWFSYIYDKKINRINAVKGCYFKTREEALNAAIFKVLDLLKEK